MASKWIGKFWRTAAVLGVVMCWPAMLVWADIPPGPPSYNPRLYPDRPERPPNRVVQPPRPELAPLRVQFNSRNEYRIVIPRKYLAAASVPGKQNALLPLNDGFRQRTVAAGIALSTVMATGFLVVLFVRRRKGRLATSVAAIGVVTLLAGGSILADVAPLPDRSPNPAPAHAWPLRYAAIPVSSPSKIAVEVTESGNEIVFYLPKDGPLSAPSAAPPYKPNGPSRVVPSSPSTGSPPGIPSYPSTGSPRVPTSGSSPGVPSSPRSGSPRAFPSSPPGATPPASGFGSNNGSPGY